MYKKLELLLVIPTIVFAHIEIKIIVPTDKRISAVFFYGRNTEVLKTPKSDLFGLTEKLLKSGVQTVSGREPDDIYVTGPTPWGDLYKKYNWESIKTNFYPYNSSVISVRKQRILLNKEEYFNNNSKPLSFTLEMRQCVDVEFVNSWNSSGILSPEDPISYLIDLGEDVTGPVDIQFHAKLGEGTRQVRSITVGIKTPITIELPPEQGVNSSIIVDRWTMQVELKYGVALDGDLVCNFINPLNKHHFWKFDINSILIALNMNQTIDATETVKIYFYRDPRVILMDMSSGETLFEGAAELEYMERP